jgi:protocatechuate 3,4-dioxygenase beta subunit
VFPGCYAGRWPHVHFEVYPDEVYARADYPNSAANLSQLSLETDMIFADGVEHQLDSISGDIDDGLTVTLSVAVDTRTPAGGGGMTGGAPPPPPQ